MLSQLQRRCYSAFSVQQLLGEEHLRETAARFGKMKASRPPVGPSKNAAVLIPLCVVNEQVALLYTVRAANLKSHGGQVSFPGGVEDAGDLNPEATALRETREELGIAPEDVQLWGAGNVVVGRGQTSVLPVIGVLRDSGAVLKSLKANPSEVREVFTVPVEALCAAAAIRHTQFRTNYSLPVFLAGKRRIWGLTAIITHLFLKAFLPRDCYDYNVKYIPPLKSSMPFRLL